ncbi:MAG: hypothetical protein FJ308_13435 [Planctomycetes bacterium]|nr:hypothetical protein [Planctomycetota bacterium]
MTRFASLHAYLVVALVLITTTFSVAIQASSRAETISLEQAGETIAEPTSVSGPTQGAERISRIVAAQDWLGPVSAIALSPFFGLACLSGIATYGPSFLREHSSLLGITGPMNNPALFWSMAALALITTLPRWTKFTKPISLAIEKLEAYSAVIILVVMRLTVDFSAASADVSLILPSSDLQIPLHLAGVITLPLDILLALAIAINMIVVNTIKLFVDVLIWITPFPAIDIVLDLIGKSLCAALLGIYAWSPWLAVVLDLLLFVACAVVFMQVTRRLRYCRDLVLKPILRKVFGGGSESPTGSPLNDPTPVFLAKPFRGFPSLSRAILELDADAKRGTLVLRGWVSTVTANGTLDASIDASGILSDSITMQTESNATGLEKAVLLIPKGTWSLSQKGLALSR